VSFSVIGQFRMWLCLAEGFHVVYSRISDQFGSPAAVQHWNVVYKTVTERYGLGPRPALVGTSRGGLYCYNWAAANPQRVSCILETLLSAT
jgi:pimeloyl-ACP methyl ester carboxylesterase